MSGFYDDDQGLEDQMLEEVEVDDGAPLDDESEAGFDAPAESAADYIQAPDMSFVTFSGHSDSVYCAAIHPSLPGVVITGLVLWCSIVVPILTLLHTRAGFQAVETMLRICGSLLNARKTQ
jgi:hypothetical protein